jgi:hypothetical protein
MFRADGNWWSNSSQSGSARSAPIDALVGVDGNCPAAENPPAGIAVGMTECDLVRVAGQTNQIEVTQGERGERKVTMTYPQGERAGIYRFRSGLLVSMDRIDPPAAPKTKRPARKKPQAARPPPA